MCVCVLHVVGGYMCVLHVVGGYVCVCVLHVVGGYVFVVGGTLWCMCGLCTGGEARGLCWASSLFDHPVRWDILGTGPD